LTPEDRAKADKERADKLEKRHADERDARRRRRGFTEGGFEPELPSVYPMGTTIGTTDSKKVGGSTPELLSFSPDGLPLVLPSARRRTFPTMGCGRTHIVDGDWKDSYLDSIFIRRCGQIAIATTCILFGNRLSKFVAFRFSRTQSCASRKIRCIVF